MSRYNYCDTTDRIYFKKDTKTAKELIISEDACDRLNDLERQLEEAREETTSLKLIIKDIIQSCREHKLNNTADEIERQLKEKGDE